ncbi:multiple sugar-binding protein precursor [mine drainage metagenome]|uniref:Multiple sugar-binding protein n=1 Tax=mine drainage metagenome TaxID=410659 RepID=A0A1J5QGS2_9ZZZZ
MKLNSRKGLGLIATVAVMALATTVMTTGAQAATKKKTLNVWWYEKGTAMAMTWNDALTAFKKAHPDVKVNFQLKTWAQLQNAGNAMLESSSAPDVTEWNKGNATAGTASQAGLLTDLSGYAKKYKWDKALTPSVKAYGQYTNGLMGNGKLYGVPSYGEYVSWFYNKDMFAKYGVTVPKTFAEFEAALAKFKAAGIAPIALAGKDYLIVHLAYGLVASQANLQWVKNYESFAHPVNFNGPEWTFGATTLSNWNKAGYLEPNAAGVDANTAVADFEKGTYPLLFGGTWLDQDVATKAQFKWGKFVMPGKLSVGSAGNLLVIPSKSKQKDLAAQFINMVISTKYENELAAKGGLPIAATPAYLTSLKDPTSKLTNGLFNSILKTQGLAMYPDWPVNGDYNELLADATQLLTDNNVANYIKKTADFYNTNKP